MTEETPRSTGSYTVAQVSGKTGIPASTIRYYDQQFEEYLNLARGAGRRRLFDDEAVERLEIVRALLRDQGLSVRQARHRLAGRFPEVVDGPSQARLARRVDALEEQVRELKLIQSRTLALVDLLTKGRA